MIIELQICTIKLEPREFYVELSTDMMSLDYAYEIHVILLSQTRARIRE